MSKDELMDDIFDQISYEAFFQFDENEPVQFATVLDGHKISITLDASGIEEPEVNFSDGNGNNFKIFLKKCL